MVFKKFSSISTLEGACRALLQRDCRGRGTAKAGLGVAVWSSPPAVDPPHPPLRLVRSAAAQGPSPQKPWDLGTLHLYVVYFSITVDLQYYLYLLQVSSRVVRQSSTLQNDPPGMPSARLAPHAVITALLTVFPVLCLVQLFSSILRVSRAHRRNTELCQVARTLAWRWGWVIAQWDHCVPPEVNTAFLE